MPKYNWSTYNSLRTKLSSKFIRFNNLNKVNYSEASYYNHTRDIFCLTLLFNKKANRKTKILDYGSNLLALSNIKSKINEKLYKFVKIHFEQSKRSSKCVRKRTILKSQFTIILQS